ncbi:integrase, catalytic region, zinc finger, CCHC-type containing protein [Tanacetum coccineum]
MQQPMPNPEDITDPTTAMNMALVLMAKAFKLNYSTPTNNNQRISSNPRNRQIAQPGMNMGQDRQMQMVGGNGGNQFRQYAGQNVGNQNGYNAVQNVGNQVVQNAVQNPSVQNVGNQNGLIVVPGIANQNPNGNGNVVAARAEGNAIRNNGNQIRCYNCRGLGHLARNCTVRPRRRDAAYLQTQLLIAQKEEAGIQLQAEEFDLMAAAADLDEIEEVNANCILMANLQQASTSGTQTDNAPVYDSDGSAEVHNYDNCYDNEIFNMFTQEEQYTELLEPIPEPHQVQQNDSNVISDISSVEQEGGTVDQHPATVEETRAYFESLYNNLALEVEKVNSVNQKMKETNADLTTELARYKNQEKCFEISQEKYDKLERCYQKSVYQEQCLTKKINALHLSSGKQITTLNEEISNLSKQLSTEKSTVSSLLEEKKKLKSDFKIREDELLDKQIQLENKIKELDNILVKTGQSIQTMHMLSPKPDSFYHTEQKMALGYQNPFYLKQAQRKQQSLYNGKVLLEKHDPPVVHDSEETLHWEWSFCQKLHWIQLQAEEFNFMATAGDLEEIKEVNANCILMANLQQASTSGTQTDNGRFYDSDGSAEPHMIQQNNSNVIFVESSVEHNGGTVEEHHATVEETRSYFESLYNNLAIEVEKANSTDDELTEKEVNQMEADDQAIQIILMGLPEDIYAAADSCETAQEIWLHVQQMMKGSDIGIQKKKAKLFNKWERFTSTDGESIESYYHRFSKLMNDFKRNKHFPEKIASNLKFLNNLQPE